MKSTDFLSCEWLLAKYCTNRKKTVDNNEINWFTFRKIAYKKDHPMTLFFETYADVAAKYNENVEFPPELTKILTVAKKSMQIDEFKQFELPVLYPEGRAIATQKKSDLLELLELIPAEFRSFYTSLNHTNEVEPAETPIEVVVEILDDSE